MKNICPKCKIREKYKDWSYCKECKRENGRNTWKRYREKYNKMKKKYCEKNKEKIRIKSKEYYKNNYKKILKTNLEYAKSTNYASQKKEHQKMIRNIKRKTRYYFPLEGHNCEFCGEVATEHHHNVFPIEFDKFNFICHNCHVKKHEELNRKSQGDLKRKLQGGKNNNGKFK